MPCRALYGAVCTCKKGDVVPVGMTTTQIVEYSAVSLYSGIWAITRSCCRESDPTHNRVRSALGQCSIEGHLVSRLHDHAPFEQGVGWWMRIGQHQW